MGGGNIPLVVQVCFVTHLVISQMWESAIDSWVVQIGSWIAAARNVCGTREMNVSTGQPHIFISEHPGR